jgi:cytochrome c oxidase subunit II
MLLAQASKLAEEVDRTFWMVGAVTVALLLGVTAAMVYFAIRYRRGRSPVVSTVAHHRWLEIAWIVLPTLIVCWMFAVGVQPFTEQRNPPANARVIEVTGRQWAWSFHYPDEGIDHAELIVPANVPIKLDLTSMPNDVIHGFYIPDFRVKEDALPGRHTHLWFQADRVGVYPVFCTQFCGKDHSKMQTVMRVVPADEYVKWIHRQIAKRYRPLTWSAIENPADPSFGPADLNIDAKAMFGVFCASCHGVNGDGSGLPGEARNFTSPRDWKHSPKVTDIFRTLTEGVANTQMRPFPNLTPYEKVALAHYVRTFLQGAVPPKDSRADFDAVVKQYGLDNLKPPKEPLPIDQAMKLLVEQRGKIRPTTAPAGGK